MCVHNWENARERSSLNGSAVPCSGLRTPELLHIRAGDGISYGANQIWYPTWIGRMAGCGPTATANLLWYLAATRKEACASLFDGDGCEQADMIRLMRTVWNYVKPGRRGVDKASILTDGAVRYGAERGVPLEACVLQIPEEAEVRPSAEEVFRFLETAFSRDLPVAFLNLSNGTLQNLDNWHWVTLVSVDASLQAEMYDQSKRQWIDLGQWITSTTLGGAFVSIGPKETIIRSRMK